MHHIFDIRVGDTCRWITYVRRSDNFSSQSYKMLLIYLLLLFPVGKIQTARSAKTPTPNWWWFRLLCGGRGPRNWKASNAPRKSWWTWCLLILKMIKLETFCIWFNLYNAGLFNAIYGNYLNTIVPILDTHRLLK